MADHNVDQPAAGEWPQANKASLASDGVPGFAVQEEDIHAAAGDFTLPPGRKYKQISLFGYTLPWYASPKFQLGMVAFVCFLCPGMFNALSGLGGGGKQDPTLADNMNTALYSTFAVFGFFGGTFVNKLGVKYTLAFGGVGYCVYALSLLLSVHFNVGGFNIFAGALLGVCAGLMWTAQGTIMISYPTENQKGRYFAWFWGIFNMGAVIGGFIPLGQNIGVKYSTQTVSDGTYIAFIVLMLAGAVLALLLCNASDVIRSDGTRVVLMKNPSWQSEFIGIWETIRFEPFIILLFPMFWSSNWFYTYQQNNINGVHFSTRTKALNSILYYSAQIIAAAIFGCLLDISSVSRSFRAKAAWVTLFVFTVAIWGGGYAYEKTYTRADVENKTLHITDWTDPGYVGPMFLYFFYGFYDAIWQATVYWFMGALSNSGRRSANYVGFYKGMQSAGSAVMWSLDARKISFLAEYASNFALLGASLIIAAPVIFYKINKKTAVEPDLAGTDETLADVLPQDHPEKVGDA